MPDCWDQYKLLLWKGWLIEWRNKIRFALLFVVPLIICVPLLGLRGIVFPYKEKSMTYTAVNLTDLSFLRKAVPVNMSVIYSPTNKVLEVLVKETVNSLHLGGFRGVKNSKLLNAMRPSPNILCVIQFDDEWAELSSLPRKLSFSIRFPSELRTSSGHWQTRAFYEAWFYSNCRNKSENFGDVPNYFREGFVQVQNALSMAFIKAVTNEKNLPEIVMQRYPCPSQMFDPALKQLQVMIMLFLPLFYIYPGTLLTRHIAIEKERQLKEMLKIIGVNNYVHWLSWFTVGLVLFSIPTAFLMFTLKVPLNDVAILRETHWTILFIYILVYVISCICFTFLIGVIFSKAIRATIAFVTIHMLTPLVFIILIMLYNDTYYVIKLMCIIPLNSAFGAGFYIMLSQELFHKGMHWNNLFTPTLQMKYLAVGHTLFSMFFSGLFYILACLYIEQVFPGKYGIAQVWYFPFSRKFWIGDTTYSHSQSFRKPLNVELSPLGKKPIVRVKNISKKYKDNVAVENITFNLYKDEIAVLLGHNGSGKSTILYMISGLIKPTSGTVVIKGFDIRKSPEEVHKSLAICPQDNILFDDLTVAQHIIFFGSLKGLRGENLKAETEKYIKLFRMQYFRDKYAQNLSSGVRRKLSICCTFCSGAELILLDEPTTSIDTTVKRDIWRILKKEKNNRMILLTTHFIEEADALADRIGILTFGELKCYGTPPFLKNTFGNSYSLVCVKLRNCKPAEVTALIKQYVPNVELQSNIGAELSYKLSTEYSHKFEKMFKDLENNLNTLKISSFGIQKCSLQDIFMRVGLADSISSQQISPDFITSNKEVLKGFSLIGNRWRAMLLKKALYIWNTPYLLLIMILLSCCPLLIYLTAYRPYDIRQLISMTFTLKQYPKVIAVVEKSKNVTKNSYLDYMSMVYAKFVMDHGRHYKVISIGNRRFPDYIQSVSQGRGAALTEEYLVAATIDSNRVIAWLNANPLHTAPLTLNLVHNALLKAAKGTDYEINVTSNPLPFTAQTMKKFNHKIRPLFKVIALLLLWPHYFFILFPIRERVIGNKLLQMVGGVGVHIFWFSSLIFDVLIYTSISLIMIIILVACVEYEVTVYFGYVFLFVLIFEFSALVYIYVVSFIFNTGVYAFLSVMVLDFLAFFIEFETTYDDLLHIFFPLPSTYLSSGLSHLDENIKTRNICSSPEIVNYSRSFKCTFYSQCCHIQPLLGWKRPGILFDIIILCTLFIIYLGILYILEYKILWLMLSKKAETVYSVWDDYADEDVSREAEKISMMLSEEKRRQRLVVNQITKRYKSNVAVQKVSFCVEPMQCFGLLGVNGAGKTTTFKMITGDIMITSGEGCICGFKILTQMSSIYGRIAYCPQLDCLLDEFTSKQTLQIFCLIRGIPSKHIKFIINELAKALDFQKYLKKRIRNYNASTKRKLSVAIACIGMVDVVLLDEPTSTMDLVAKRQSWNIFCLLRDEGSSLVLSSHSMDECEALCNQVTIMVQGQLMCLGSIRHLKKKYSNGLTMKVKMNTSNDVEQSLAEQINELTLLIFSKYPNSVLEESHDNLLRFYIPLTDVTWSEIFGFMERNRERLNIEDYSIDQASLDQVLLEISKDTRRFTRVSR